MAFGRRTPGIADILYVMAVDTEYGPHLEARLTPHFTGIGPVEAGISLTHALTLLKSDDRLPALIVSLGSARSRTLEPGRVYQANSVSYRDMDASALGFEKGATPVPALPPTLPLSPSVPGLRQASLSTGGNIVSGAGYDGLNADMVDMETYALKRAADKFDLPLVAIRGISDGNGALNEIGDWTHSLHLIEERLAEAVDLLEAAISAGTLE